MHRNEDRAALGIRGIAASAQAHEVIPVPRHHHRVARVAQRRPQPQRDVQRVRLLRDALPRAAAAIMPAVAGIDHDRGQSHRRPGEDEEKEETKERADLAHRKLGRFENSGWNARASFRREQFWPM